MSTRSYTYPTLVPPVATAGRARTGRVYLYIQGSTNGNAAGESGLSWKAVKAMSFELTRVFMMATAPGKH